MENQRVIDFRYAPPSQWTSIGLVDDFYKTLVREDGALLYNYASDTFTGGWHFKRVVEFGIRAAHGPEKVTQVTETARFACVVTTLEYAKAVLELKAFGHEKDGHRSDVVLWSIRLKEGVDHFLTGLKIDVYERSRLFLGRSAAPARAVFSIDPGQQTTYEFWETSNTYQEEDPSRPGPGPLAFISTEPLIFAHPTGFRPCSAFGTEPIVLKKGEVLKGAILLPQNYQEEVLFDLAQAEQAYTEARQYWDSIDLLSLPFQIPDPAVMEMLVACARNILQAREIKDGLPVFQVGATVYRGLWVVDGHFLLEAAHYMGRQEDAYTGVDTLLKRVQPDGSINIMKYHTKETGISLLTLVRQCEVMGDDQRLRELWPVIRNAAASIEAMRKEAYALPPDSPCYQLYPMAFADGGLGGWRGEYTTVFWILSGLNAVASAAARLGFQEDAERFQADFDSLLTDFRRHAAQDMQTLPDGTPYLPICKPGSGEHVWIPDFPKQVPDYLRLTPASATWAFCQAIYPGEIFAPDDPLVQNLLKLYEQVDDHEGVPAFTGWIPYQSLWNYHASFGAHAWLYADRGDKALDYLYAFANHATPTRVWREEQSFADSEEGQLIGDMPHNWASAEFIRLARHLVVLERGNGLDLLAGVPAEWRVPGAVVNFEQTPTRFGPVSLRLETRQDCTFTLDLTLDPTWSLQPETIRAKLPARNVLLNGTALPARETGWTDLPVRDHIHLEGNWLA